MVETTDYTDFTDKDSCLLLAGVRRPSSGLHPLRALCLLSGGLDSQLAARLLREQGIEGQAPQGLRTLAVLPAAPDMVESQRI